MVNTMRDTTYVPRAREPETPEPTIAPLVALTTKELWACVEDYATTYHAEKVAYVRAETDAARVRRLIIRLIELRWSEDVEWRRVAPLLALHETSLVVEMKHKTTGITFTVNGRLAPRPWVWTFAELERFTRAANGTTLADDDAFATLVRAKHYLDLEHVP